MKGLKQKNGPGRGKFIDGGVIDGLYQIFFFFWEKLLLEGKKSKGAPSFEPLSAPTSIGTNSWGI